MSETFVRLAPEDTWRAGWNKDRLIQAMRASLVEIPGVDYNFSQPIKDNVEEAVSGVRGQVVLKIFGTDLAVMKTTLEKCVDRSRTCPASSTSACTGTPASRSCRSCSTARPWRGSGIDVSAAEGHRRDRPGWHRDHRVLQNERPGADPRHVPVAEREDEERIGSILVPNRQGAMCPCARWRASRRPTAGPTSTANRTAACSPPSSTSKAGIWGRWWPDAMKKVAKDVRVPEGNFPPVGRGVREPARALARLAVIVPFSFLVVFALLYTALNSVRSAAVVLLVAPLAMSGGVFALALTHIPLSVSAAVGFIALLGQVCLASLLVVSAVDDRRREGATAGCGAGRRRGQPVPRRVDDGHARGAGPDADGGLDGRGQRNRAAVRGGDHRRPVDGHSP
jgi:cobalt-zinc-cadmium resistance protein CzcA